jgi:hypothetical protein
LASGGYIINIKPIAIGMFVVPLENELMKLLLEGKKYPSATPRAIARKIQRVKNRSRKPSFFLSAAGVQFVDVIFSN